VRVARAQRQHPTVLGENEPGEIKAHTACGTRGAGDAGVQHLPKRQRAVDVGVFGVTPETRAYTNPDVSDRQFEAPTGDCGERRHAAGGVAVLHDVAADFLDHRSHRRYGRRLKWNPLKERET
jgi:hypothetical protein